MKKGGAGKVMHVVLSIYSEKAFKEFVMPFSLNIETAISVRGDVFGLPEDLGQYRIMRNPQKCDII